MTCIVALIHENKVLLGGDAAASDEKSGLIFQRTDPKVFKVGQYGIGFVDSFRMGQILQYNWTPPIYKPTSGYRNLDKFMRTKFVQSVKEAYQEHGYGRFGSNTEDGDEGGIFLIAVQGAGRIFAMDSDFHIGEADVMYMAEGAGQELALGSLFSTVQVKTPRKRVRMALEERGRQGRALRHQLLREARRHRLCARRGRRRPCARHASPGGPARRQPREARACAGAARVPRPALRPADDDRGLGSADTAVADGHHHGDHRQIAGSDHGRDPADMAAVEDRRQRQRHQRRAQVVARIDEAEDPAAGLRSRDGADDHVPRRAGEARGEAGEPERDRQQHRRHRLHRHRVDERAGDEEADDHDVVVALEAVGDPAAQQHAAGAAGHLRGDRCGGDRERRAELAQKRGWQERGHADRRQRPQCEEDEGGDHRGVKKHAQARALSRHRRLAGRGRRDEVATAGRDVERGHGSEKHGRQDRDVPGHHGGQRQHGQRRRGIARGPGQRMEGESAADAARLDAGRHDRVVAGMEDAVAETGQRHQRQQPGVAGCQRHAGEADRQQQQPARKHAGRAVAVDHDADHCLADAGEAVEDRDQQSQLGEADAVMRLHRREQRRQDELEEMAAEMRDADRRQDAGEAEALGSGDGDCGHDGPCRGRKGDCAIRPAGSPVSRRSRPAGSA